jgi:septum formation protein
MQPKIILASSSPFRKDLLNRLNLDFECHSPNIDESQLVDETATDYVCRLAKQKAQAISKDHPNSIVIGSDQCALRDDQILGKPGNHANAMQQLKAAQGKTVVFHTGLCVLHDDANFIEVDEVLYKVKFRTLSDAQLSHYLTVEQPYQCAGSFKSEGYGSCLFSAMEGNDPSALIGLPLIRLVSMLENAGFAVV